MKLYICTEHTGKMEGMHSLSTSCAGNPTCLHNSTIEGSICSHCYALQMMKMYKDLNSKLMEQNNVLFERLLSKEEIPFINSLYFRFEAFGDLHNEIQLQNYINIAKANPQCRFVLWTKAYNMVVNYFKTHSAPNNFVLIISSLLLNQVCHTFTTLSHYTTIPNLKVFTVFDKETALKDKVNINCGGRLCRDCLACYKKGGPSVINEILKSDRVGYYHELDK